MAVNGLNGRVSFAWGGTETYTVVYSSTAYRWELFTGRDMHNISPLGSRFREWAPGKIQWSVRFWGYLDQNVNPGFFNIKTVATLTLYTDFSVSDRFSGSVWIEDMRPIVACDDASRLVILMRGTSTLTETF